MNHYYLKIRTALLALFIAAINPNQLFAETQSKEWGSLEFRCTQGENSKAIYLPEMFKNTPRLGIFGANKTSDRYNYGLSLKQVLTPLKLDRSLFFADIRFGEETYQNLNLEKKKFNFLELGFFVGTNLAWPQWKNTIVASVGVIDRSNYISNAALKNSELGISRRDFSPAWQVWFVF